MSEINRFGLISPEALTPDHVRGLALSDVTEQYGTLGLVLRLKDTLARTGLTEIPEVSWAVQFGLMLHANDVRSNGHYTDHLLRVTLRTIEHYGIVDPVIAASCMLHDGPEDHAKDIVFVLTKEHIDDEAQARSIAFELLGGYVGTEITEVVSSVTNPITAPGEDNLIVYREHTRKLVTNFPKGRVVKLSDFTDNAVGNHYTVGPKQAELDRKYIDQYQLHRAGLFMPDSLITGSDRDYALQQLVEGHARALARLAMTET